jgi:tape measure domain-containing protein
MADAAQLKLQVGLDLAFFRQQLAQLGTVAVGYQMPINIKLDPLTVQQELSRLKKKIGKTQYTVKIDTNIENEINNADRLVKALQRVQREGGRGRSGLPVDIRQLRKTKGQGGFSAADIKTLFGAAIAGGLLDEKTLGKTREQMVTAFASIGKDSIEGLLNGLSSADASIRAAAESIGETLIATTKASLGMRSPSKKFEEIGKNVGLGFEKGVLSSMDAAFNALERKMQQRTRVLDAMARGIFHMLGMDPASMMAAQRQKLLPPTINWQSSVATPPQYQSKRGTMLTGAPAPTLIGGAPGPFGLLPRTTRAGAMGDMMRMLSQGAGEELPGKLALSPEAAKARVDAIISQYLRVVEVQIKESFSAPAELKKQLNVFSYLAQSLRDAEQRVKQNKIDSAVDSLINALENLVRKTQLTLGIEKVSIADLGANRPLLAGTSYSAYPALPAAGETGKNRVRISTGNPFESLPLLPPVGGTTPRSQMPLHAVSTGAYVGQPPFMRAPSVPPSMATGGGQPPIPPGGGRGGFGSLGGFGNAMAGIQLPSAGLVSELGSEFAQAAKQVLLFGTAYKALAFLTGFPGQVSEAVAQLQTFNNTLKAITPSSDEFRIANQFILDTVDKYNVPLQSAREGFTNLYASMEPAGFKGNEIRDIFTGVSQAAATFGMSADRVDRVNYAFAQMASKGQVMSEELKGQLGDVLPGAVAIFAKAAGFTGPNAMVDFTKAMEDGRYKGEAMKQLLINVGIVMKDKFAKGAEGAAQSFQGQMNAMATATQKLYESFTPVANLFASNVVKPLTEGIKVAAEGFNAFFSGAATKTAGGFALSQELEKMRPMFKGIADNIKQLLPLLQSFATTTLGLAKILLQIASNPFVGYLARAYLAVLPLTMAIQVLNLQALIPMIGSLLRAIPAFIAFSTAAWNGASRTVALRIAMQATGQTATIAGGQVALLSNTLKTAFVGTVVGAVVIGIGMIIERIMTLSSKMEEAKGNALRLQDSIKGMSKTELQVEENKLGRQGALLQGLQRGASGQKYALLNKQQEEMVMNLAPGSITRVAKAGKGGNKLVEVASGLKAIGGGLAAIDVTMLPAIEQKIQSLRQNIDSARLTLNASDQNTNLNLAPIPGAGDDPKAAAKAAAALASRQALADKLSSDQTKTDIERQKTLFENEKSMINMAYDLREARANSFQKETIRFQRELFNIEMERQKAVLDANSAITKAQGAVAGGTGGATGLLQGKTGISSGAHFDVRRQDGGYISPQQARALFDASVAKQLQLTSTYGPRKAPVAGASTFHRGVDLAGPANTPLNLAQGYSMVGAGMKGGLGYTASVRGPQGEMYDVGHLQQPSVSIPSGKVTARQKRVALADQETENALQDRKVNITLAEAVALEKAKIATENYVASIMPVAELQLQNQLADERNRLQLAGISDAALEYQMSMYEAKVKEMNIEKELLDLKAKKANTPNSFTPADQSNLSGLQASLDKLKKTHPDYYAALAGKKANQVQSAYASSMSSLQNQLQLAGIVDPYAEQRQKYMQGGQSAEQADAQVQLQKQIDSIARLRDAYRGAADTIGSSFGDTFKGIITGSMSAQEALGSFFQNIGNYFADMAAKMIAEWLKVQLIEGMGSLFSMFSPGLGSGIAPGPIARSAGVVYNPGKMGPAFANGGIATGGFRAFATGGIVTGPTLGLVGEGRYNEAVIPLPDGKSVPVDLMGAGGGTSGPVNVVVNVDAKGSTVEGDKDKAGDLGRAISAAVQSELIKQQRPGGILSGPRR